MAPGEKCDELLYVNPRSKGLYLTTKVVNGGR